MTFTEAEAYLSSLISFERYGQEKRGQQFFCLSTFRHILDRIGNPEKRLRAIHVGGTDGKGSTCQYLSAILRAAGYTVGTYTSPHLETVRERIQINGDPIPESLFASEVERIKPVLDSIPNGLPSSLSEPQKKPPSYFEALTAITFSVFDSMDLDFCVIEVGLGGRLDATNVLTPLACVITPLDLEHTELLGDTLESIAREKAGIAKPGVPVVISRQVEGIDVFLAECCQERGGIPYRIGNSSVARILERTFKGYSFELLAKWGDDSSGSSSLQSDDVLPPYPVFTNLLIGDHQIENAALAIYTINLLETKKIIPKISTNILCAGLSATKWPARIDLFYADANDDEPLIVLDCAHTIQAARTLRKTLDQLFPNSHRIFMVGLLHGKRVEEFLEELIRSEDELFCAQPISERAISSEELLRIAQNYGSSKRYECLINAKECKDNGLFITGFLSRKRDCLLVIAGSIYLAAEMRPLLFSSGLLTRER